MSTQWLAVWSWALAFAFCTQLPAASVRDFGAKGDGITDDSAAIQRALTSGVSDIPDGTYVVASTLSVQNSLNGAGRNTILRYTGSGWAIEATKASRISGLVIQGNGSAAGGIRIAATRYTIERVRVAGFPKGTGFRLEPPSWIGSIRDCQAYQCRVGLQAVARSDTDRSFNATIISGGCYESCDWGIVLGDPDCPGTYPYWPGHGSVIEGVCIEGNRQGGCWIQAGRSITVRDCYFELNGGFHVRFGGKQPTTTNRPNVCRVADCSMIGATAIGIDLSRALNCRVGGNVIDGSGAAITTNPDFTRDCDTTGNVIRAK